MLDDGVALADLILTPLASFVSDHLQRIHIVKVNPIESINRRINVPRHGNINQEQRSPAAFSQHWNDMFREDDVMRR